jgi:rRNA maturation protein Nop10
MRRCNACNKLYQTDFVSCPLCGKHTVSWIPTQELEPKFSVPDTLQKIVQFLLHMGD